ncbi:hypothetical protein BSFA1_67530 (plasmid) [Burkholderia sp. SFA1]|nr:hypothetical protein BSFA1_67530 [Burkholderia sp. SFA1]
MMRRIAVVGDKLSNDGEVCHYTGMMFTIGSAGRQVALIDAAAYCPVCKTTGYIAKDGGPRRMTLGSSEIALDQDLMVCGCPEHPRVVATLAGEAWYDDLAETLGTVSLRETMSRSAATAASLGCEFDETYVLRDRATGKLLENVAYRLVSTRGTVVEGVTDRSGKTQRIKTSAAERITVRIGEAE